MQAPPSVPQIQRSNWFSRNWKWLVPSGCLAVLLVVIAFVTAVFFLTIGLIKQSEVYKVAFSRAEGNPRVVAALGSPIKSGNIISGRTHVEGPSGEASLSIPVNGPKGKGKIYVEAKKSAGVWQFPTLIVEIQGTGERIDLNQTSQVHSQHRLSLPPPSPD